MERVTGHQSPLKKWQETANRGFLRKPLQKTFQYHTADDKGFDTVAVSPLYDNNLEQSLMLGGVKCGVINDELENEQLSDVISAWSMLPPNIQEAILLLVRQYAQ